MLHQSTGRDRKREPSNSYVPLPGTNRGLTPDFLYAALDTTACAAFITESRMNFANANQPHRKSAYGRMTRIAGSRLPVKLRPQKTRAMRQWAQDDGQA
jgi:hypothetical protein